MIWRGEGHPLGPELPLHVHPNNPARTNSPGAREVNELSLFSGMGGGLLGTKLLGFTHIGYVEINDYCQRIIKQRVEDGILDQAPIFGDIRTFISEGYAESYKGLVDVITAGFPCQPFSVAGNHAGEHDERNMWPETIKCIRIVRPKYVWLENVPGLLSRKHRCFEEILKNLAESGYDAKWKIVSASEVGSPHKRDRVFIVADSQGFGRNEEQIKVSLATGLRPQGEIRGFCSQTRNQAWLSKSRVDRVVNGGPYRVDRIGALGNGQVPAVVRAAWHLLK